MDGSEISKLNEMEETKEKEPMGSQEMVPKLVKELIGKGLGQEGKETVYLSIYRFGGVSFKDWGGGLNTEQKEEVRMDLLRGMLDHGWWFQSRSKTAYVFISTDQDRNETVGRLKEFCLESAPKIIQEKYDEFGRTETIPDLYEIMTISLGQDPVESCPVIKLPEGAVFQAAPASNEVVTGAIGHEAVLEFEKEFTRRQLEEFKKLPVLLQDTNEGSVKVFLQRKKKVFSMRPIKRNEGSDRSTWQRDKVALADKQKQTFDQISVDSYFPNGVILEMMGEGQKDKLAIEIVEVPLGERIAVPVKVHLSGDLPDIDLGGMSYISEIIKSETIDPVDVVMRNKMFGLLMRYWQTKQSQILKDNDFGSDNFGGDSISGLGRSRSDAQEMLNRAQVLTDVSRSFNVLLDDVLEDRVSLTEDPKELEALKWLAVRVKEMPQQNGVVVKVSLESVDATLQFIPSFNGGNSFARLVIDDQPKNYLLEAHKAWQRKNPNLASVVIGPKMLSKIQQGKAILDPNFEIVNDDEGNAILVRRK